jgi:hypothetical protein
MMPDYDVTTFETWRPKAEDDFTAASILAEHDGPAAGMPGVPLKVTTPA